MTDAAKMVTFEKCVIDINGDKDYIYEEENPNTDYVCYDSIVFEKGQTFIEKELKKQGYPLKEWLQKNICKYVKTAFQRIVENPPIGRNIAIDNIMGDLQGKLFFNDKKFIAPRLAGNIIFENFDENNLLGRNRGFLVVDDIKNIYWYNGRFYEENGKDIVLDVIQKSLRTFWKTKYREETINWIKDCKDIQIKREKFDSKPTELVLENCVYDVLTGETKEFSPKNRPTTAFPIPYNSDAKCPDFIQFLKDVHYLEDINLIQEMFGYALYKPYAFQKAFMLVGPGANGKSTELNVLGAMIGERNMCNIPLQSICNDRFTNVDLVGKYANICGDLSEKGLRDTSTFLKLTGGDFIRAEKKYAPNGIYFKNTAKLIFSCNLVPECKNQTFAYKRRWVVIEYPNVFLEDDPNTDLFIEEKLIKEIPGIFNWSMVGLKRLLENGMFNPHKTLDEVEQYMAENQDSVKIFCDTCIEPEVTGVVLRSRVYKTYIEFCKFHSLKMVANTQFTTKVERFGPNIIERGQSRVKKGKTWHGIKIKPFLLEKEGKPDIEKSEKKELVSGLYINGVLVPPDTTGKKNDKKDGMPTEGGLK